MVMFVFPLICNLLGESEQKRAQLNTAQDNTAWKYTYCDSSRSNNRVINYLYSRDCETMGIFWHRWLHQCHASFGPFSIGISLILAPEMAFDACLSYNLDLCACQWLLLLLLLASKCSTSSQWSQAADSPYLISSRGGRHGMHCTFLVPPAL